MGIKKKDDGKGNLNVKIEEKSPFLPHEKKKIMLR